MRTFEEAVASREGLKLARSILGTTDARRVTETLDSFCASHLGAGLQEIFFCELSTGGAFGLRLRDSRQLLLKVHPPDRGREFLKAVHRVQRHLYAKGFPCPRPVLGPVPFGQRFATAEEFVDTGEPADAHDPAIRRSMARALARTIELCNEISGVEALSQGWTWPDEDLWPAPHNALFDFETTAAGAEWIDSIASEARRCQPRSAGRTIAGHTDWSVKHFRFVGNEIQVIYDWDSLRLDSETVIVGTAAATFPATWYLKVESRAPSPEEMKLFIGEYEAARGERLSARDREATFVAATYVMAYCARCEHSIDMAGTDLRGSFREALARYGREYLQP